MYRMGKRTMGSAFAPVKKRSKKTTSSGQLAALKRKVARLQPELKDLQVTQLAFDPTAAAGQIDYLSGTVVGTSDVNRIGKKINITNIRVRVSLSVSPAAGHDTCMVFLIRDRESAGVVPTISGAATSIFTSFSPHDVLQRASTIDRFTILNQWTFNSAAALADYNLPNRVFEWKGNMVLEYADDTAAQTGASKNALYLVALATVDTFDMNYAVHCKFTDV